MKSEDHPSMEVIPEVELSAADLAELSAADLLGVASPVADSHAQRSTETSVGVVRALRQQPASVEAAPHLAARTTIQSYKLHMIGVLSIALVGSIALGAHYTFTSSEPPAQIATRAWTPLPERPAQVVEEEEPAPAPPTLYRNPFDESEVFELAPGLSQDEARAIVADLLIERARQRSAR